MAYWFALARHGLYVLIAPLLYTRCDLAILLIKSGLLNCVVVKVTTGRRYPYMTRAEKQESLEQIAANAQSATRVAWYRIGIAAKTSKDFTEEAKRITAPVLPLWHGHRFYRVDSRQSTILRDVSACGAGGWNARGHPRCRDAEAKRSRRVDSGLLCGTGGSEPDPRNRV